MQSIGQQQQTSLTLFFFQGRPEMTISTVPASQGSATFSDLNVVCNLTVSNTLPGDTVEIINEATLAVLGVATQISNTTNWRASFLLPSNTTTVNVSARTKRGSAYSVNSVPSFVITYQVPTA